jgi:hypothetical protein
MLRSAVFALVSVIAWGVPAGAGPPSPATSQLDPCIVTCPAGDSLFVAIVREINGGPFHSGEEAKIDLCGCPDVRLAAAVGGDSYWLAGCTVLTLTDLDGIARFPLAAGGVCSNASVRIFCEGMPLATRHSVASFDQDGDMVVSGNDLALVDARLGTSDPTADFNCDGVVTSADYEIAATHLGHFHPSIVGVESGTGISFGVQPAPNPSRGPTDFVLRTPARGQARLAVYDLAGRRLATVIEGEIEPGVHHVAWAGRDAAGRTVPAGLYLYRLTIGSLRTGGSLVIAR